MFLRKFCGWHGALASRLTLPTTQATTIFTNELNSIIICAADAAFHALLASTQQPTIDSDFFSICICRAGGTKKNGPQMNADKRR